jgi:hypothetical protein
MEVFLSSGTSGTDESSVLLSLLEKGRVRMQSAGTFLSAWLVCGDRGEGEP